MGYFSDNTSVNFSMLKESGVYSSDLLEELKNGNYEMMKFMTDVTQRKDRDFMEPLLYAVKNEYATYEVYKYYGENLQEDIELAKKIVVREPELIRESPISYNKQFILEAVEINPKVVMHMSSILKEDGEFVEELCELRDPEIIKYAAKECKMPEVIGENPKLSRDPVFMKEVIKQDVNNFAYLPEEFKNNHGFMKDLCKGNKEVIKYISENTDGFGKEGLIGTKEALVDISTEEAVAGFDEEQRELKEKIEIARETEDDRLEELLKRDKQLERHKKFFERIKNGEVDPVRAAKMIDKYCSNLDEGVREELKQLLKIDEAIVERQKEEEKDKEGTVEPKEEGKVVPESKEVAIQPGDIEVKTEGATLEGIGEETRGIREGITIERNSNEIGEQTNDDNDERT